jgi:putative addiction module component (TIGR02574 family)
MAYDINEILALPVRERRKISEKLLSSLPENKSLSDNESDLVKELDKRWKMIQEGEVKLLTSTDFKKRLKKKYGKLIK